MTAVVPRTQIAPRPLFCPIAHLHRDREVAEAVRAGRFTHAGVTRHLGREPDWLGAPLPDDEEWRIEWSKFYYGLDLAHAFRESGDPGFLRAWERLVRSWIRGVPVGADSSDVAARRITNWLYAWDAFAVAPGFPGLDEGLADELLASIAVEATYVGANLTPERNHRTLELYALFLVVAQTCSCWTSEPADPSLFTATNTCSRVSLIAYTLQNQFKTSWKPGFLF